MRAALVGFLLLAFTAVTRASEVEILRVWTSWRDAASFDRISEYFGRGENTGRQRVLRTQPAARPGYYFLVRLKNPALIDAAKFELSIIRPDNPEAKIYTFTAAVPPKETVFQLGLTGTDWPEGQKAHPVAWKLALLGADGRVLAERKSFLWELPAK